MTDQTHWIKQAMSHTRALAERIGARGATSDKERQAANYVRNKLQKLELKDVRQQTFMGFASAWISTAAAFSIAAWGMVLGMLLGAVGGLAAVIFYLLAAWIVYREINFQGSWLRRRLTLWQAPSQNVIGVAPPLGPAERQVVLVAHLDTARSGFFWRGTIRKRAWGCLLPLAFVSLPLNAFFFLLAVLTGKVGFYFATLVPLFLQTVMLVITLRAGRSRHSPGANNNAAGVGVILALAERLKAEPLQCTQVWVLASGCRETGLEGVRAFLEAHGDELEDALFIGFERVGVGERLVCLTGEGSIRPLAYHPEALALIEEAARTYPELDVQAGVHPGTQTEIGLATRRGFKGLLLTAQPDDGSSLPYWRQMNDTVGVVEAASVGRVLALAWALLKDFDANP